MPKLSLKKKWLRTCPITNVDMRFFASHTFVPITKFSWEFNDMLQLLQLIIWWNSGLKRFSWSKILIFFIQSMSWRRKSGLPKHFVHHSDSILLSIKFHVHFFLLLLQILYILICLHHSCIHACMLSNLYCFD